MRWVRCVMCALAAVAFAPCAFAADLDDLDVLRGSEPVGPATFPRWSGFYFGGQFGYSDGNADFSNSADTPIAESLSGTPLANDISSSEWSPLGSADHTATAFGGFVGYDTQWQDAIVGFEVNVDHTNLSLLTANSVSTNLTAHDDNGNSYLVSNLSNAGTVTNLDYGTLRMRGGYILGNFLPYGFIGLALGRADVNVTATAQGEENPPGGGGACVSPCVPVAFSSTAGKNGALLYGGTVGGGVDVALTQNVFLRGEFEYTVFAPISDVLISIVSARVGAGLKF